MELLLIDLNYIYNKYYYVASQREGDVHKTCHSMLLEFFHRIPSRYKIIFCIDGTNPVTKSIFEEYKMGRPDKSKLYEHYEDFHHILAKEFPTALVLKNDEAEADELIAYFVIENRHKKVLVFSGDKDLLQLSTYCDISNTFKNGEFIRLSKVDILSKFKYNKEEVIKDKKEILAYRVFSGDTSDKIPPAIPRLPWKSKQVLVDLLAPLDEVSEETIQLTVDELFNRGEEVLAEKVLAYMNEIIRNYKLMSLLNVYKKKYVTENIRKVR